MADVFISYAREDQQFVRKLQDALEAHNRNTWIDWKDVPLTAKWKEEVFSAIDQADSFAAVISPDFIVSKPCQDELDHAAHNHKRMVPLWHRDVDDEEVPPDLAAHQYVFLREDDDFEDAFERLLKALDTDMEWVHAHTRLLVRAKEWESKRQDSSMLLRGSELREAEEWQARAAHKEPKPTTLQSEYILASRRAASRRYRATIGVMGLAAVFFVVLTAISLWQWREARSNAQEAQANAQEARTQASIALSRLLLAQATELQESQPDVSLLLNVEALRRAPAAAKEEREEVRFALLDKLDRPYHPSTPLTGHTEALNDVEFSPDGKLLASSSYDNTVRLWDVATGKPRIIIGTSAEEHLPDQFESAMHYVTVDFEPAFSFEVGQDWEFLAPETTHRVDVGTGPKGGELIFTNPSHVYDPSNPSEPKELPAPQNAKEWLSWFQRHPNLDTSKPVPVSVGGTSGMRIDVTASSTPENYPRKICGKQPCVPLYPIGGWDIFSTPPGAGKDRYVIVEIGGEAVVINVFAPPGKFDTFSPKAQEVLDSVERTGG
jgi:hypothetical protein